MAWFVSRKKYADLAIHSLKQQGEIDRLKQDILEVEHKARFEQIFLNRLLDFYMNKAIKLEFDKVNPRADNGKFCGIKVVK